jgi:hypothetical protein
MPSVEEMNKMFDDKSGGESPLPNIDVVASEEEEASPVAVSAAEELSESEVEGVEDYGGVGSVQV